VIPRRNLERDDRRLLRVDAEVLADQNAERGLLAGLNLERAADELAEQRTEVVGSFGHRV
jgi:hypothetical protein